MIGNVLYDGSTGARAFVHALLALGMRFHNGFAFKLQKSIHAYKKRLYAGCVGVNEAF